MVSLAEITSTTNEISPDAIKAFLNRVNREPEILTPAEKQAKDLTIAYRHLDTLLADPNSTFDEKRIREFHGIIAANMPIEPYYKGNYCPKPKRIVDAGEDFVPFIDPHRIPEEMEKLGRDFKRFMKPVLPNNRNVVASVHNAANFLWRLSDIHPFKDGNGRTGRLGADAILMRAGLHQTPDWVDQRKTGKMERKAQFYNVVRESCREQSDGPVARFLTIGQVGAIAYEIAQIQKNRQALVTAESTGYLKQRQQDLHLLRTALSYKNIT